MDPFSGFPSISIPGYLRSTNSVQPPKKHNETTGFEIEQRAERALREASLQPLEIAGTFDFAHPQKPLFEREAIQINQTKATIKRFKALTPAESLELSKLPKEERLDKIKQLLRQESPKSLPLDQYKPTLLAIIETESSFNPLAISADGFQSKGLFQLLDKTGFTIKSRLNDSAPYSPLNPSQNIRYGSHYFEYLLSIFQTPTVLTNGLSTKKGASPEDVEKFSIAAFNCGEGRVAQAQLLAEKNGLNAEYFSNVKQFLPEITQKYVEKVLRAKEKFSAQINGKEFAS